MATESNSGSLSKETKVTIGLALVLVAPLVLWMMKDTAWKTNIERDIREIRHTQESQVVPEGTYIEAKDFDLWAERLQAANPTLTVPPPRGLGVWGGQ